MRVLILGGSYYFGRLVIQGLLDYGADVTVANKGRSATPLPAGIRHIKVNRAVEDELDKLTCHAPWDVVVDISGKNPSIVGQSARSLAELADRYAYVSTVQVYEDWPYLPVDETSRLKSGGPKLASEDIHINVGRSQAMCEEVCQQWFGENRLLVLRLLQMIGQFEYIGPLQAWFDRMQGGDPILIPSPDQSVQFIDVRDAAAFLVNQVNRKSTGIMNVGAPPGRSSYADFVKLIAKAVNGGACHSRELIWVDGTWLIDQGVKEWTEVPLWRNADALGLVSVETATACGLQSRLLDATISDAWQWLVECRRLTDEPCKSHYGMSQEREHEIINRWLRSFGSQNN